MTKVAVKKEVLNWAIDRSKRTIEDLRGKFPKITEWIEGSNEPTLRQLESLAKATRTPFGFFFLNQPPEIRLPIPYFRTPGGEGLDKPSPDLIETIQLMQQRQSWIKEFWIEEGKERLSIVRSATVSEPPNSIAQRIRDAIGFDESWAARQGTWTKSLKILREAIEAAGIMVVVNGVVGNNTHRKLDVEEFRGFVLVDDYAPLVFINGTDGKAAQMFTLAHELAHVFLGSSAAFDLRRLQPANDPIEKACNSIAAEFLVPASRLREIWPDVRGDDNPFQSLARIFKISSLVAARRALDLRIISQREFFDFYQDYLDSLRLHHKKGERGDFYATQNLKIGKLFARTLLSAVREGRLLYHDAYRLTGLYGHAFERYAESLGFGGHNE